MDINEAAASLTEFLKDAAWFVKVEPLPLANALSVHASDVKAAKADLPGQWNGFIVEARKAA
jgi:hypothetical protein